MKQHSSEWKKILTFFGVWMVIEALLMALTYEKWIPQELSWIVWAPVGIILITIILSVILIILSYAPGVRQFWRKYFTREAKIGHKTITRCEYCPYAIRKDNPVNPSFPIHKCEEKEMRLILNPQSIPWWCPHAGR